jgi:diacylglycerol kinase family enzyme
LSRFGWQSAESARRPVLLVNPRSGGGAAVRSGLVQHAQERGIEAVVLEAGQGLASLARRSVEEGADALGMAGGDGSLAVVAAVARAHGVPFVCIPAGTRNHFALDLGIDRHDVVGALDAFGTDALERSIDVGEVNGRVFLNNVSLGIYGDAVRREDYRDAKVRILLQTAAEVLGPSRTASELRVVDDVGHEHRTPAVVLVSNNPYALDRPLARGTRPRLDGGELGVVVLERPSAHPTVPAHEWRTTNVTVHATAPVHAGVDGEAVELDTQLELVIRPRALRVRLSSRHPGASPSGLLAL